MDIINKLNGGTAFMVEDAGTKYPIFAETLHAREIFDNLISSGYKFCNLPYDFRKEGVSIMSLPDKTYPITQDEEQDMYDLDDLDKYDAQELRSKVSLEDVNYIVEPPAKYTISTREKFLAYLKDIESRNNDDDFLPINYFVHPAARFSVEEWLSGEYVDYFRVMETRRSMSYQKFLKLRDWLVSAGMPASGNAYDIVDYYSMWGVDGVRAQFVSRRRKISYVDNDFMMQAGLEADAYELTRTEEALVDRYGAIFPPEDVKAGYDGWRVQYTRGTKSKAFTNKIAQLGEGEFGTVSVVTKSEEEILELDTLKESISITPHLIKCGNARNYMFRVFMPDVTAGRLPVYWWSAIHDNRVNDMANLRALAYLLLQQRKYTGDASSFRVMMDSGCDIRGALCYILNKDLSQPDEDSAEDAIPTEDDIDMFLNKNYDPEDLTELQTAKFDTIESIISGKMNIGAIAFGEKADMAMDIDAIYKYLYCAHFCSPKVPISKMYKLIKDVEHNVVKHTSPTGIVSDVLPIPADGYTINVPAMEIRGKVDGYKADMNSIKVKQSEQCCGFLKVVQIASEYGTEQPRHVAFEAQTVNLHNNGGKALKYLESIMEIFEEQLTANVPLSMQPTYRLYKRTTCMAEYFRAAENGVIRFPSFMGGAEIELPLDVAIGMGKTIQTRITSTAVYCRKMVDSSGYLTHYCVNANITPWYIYPITGVKIPSANLPALWYDWDSQGQHDIAEKLAMNGYTYIGFIPWTRRYLDFRYFKDISELPDVADLAKYMNYCNKFRSEVKTTEIFEHAPHLESLVYDYYPDETVLQDNGVQLREEGTIPTVVVSKGHIVTKEDHPEYGVIDIKPIKVESLRRFTGFDAEDFYMVPDIVKVELPSEDEKYITVEDGRICLGSSDPVPAYSIMQMCGRGYPVIKLWGGKYIFRDLFGSLWEVVV